MLFNQSRISTLVCGVLASHFVMAGASQTDSYFDTNQKNQSVQSKHSQISSSDGTVMTKGHLNSENSSRSFFWNHGQIKDIQLDESQSKPIQYKAALDSYFSQVAVQHGAHKSGLTGIKADTVHNTGRGAIIAKYQQRVDGLDVFGRSINVVINRNNEFVASSGYFANAHKPTQPSFELSHSQAMSKAFERQLKVDVGIDVVGVELSNNTTANYSSLFDNVDYGDHVLSKNSRVKRVLYPAGKQLLSAYYVEAETSPKGKKSADLFSYIIDAHSGDILFSHNLTAHVATTYKVFAETTGDNIPFDGPQGNALTPHPTGEVADTPAVGSTFVSENTVTLDNAGLSTNDPWLTTSETTTAGNNVDAYADISGQNGFDATDVRPTMTSANAFEYDFGSFASGLSGDPQKHAVVNLFYVNNFLHDWFYDSGFDEAAGNAQNSNFGRGGVGNDRLLVEAQDSSGTNNANMSTPSDGGNPRMQMFLWDFLSDFNLTISGITGITTQTAGFGPTEYDVSGVMSLIDDGTANTTDGCETISTDLSGKIAIIDRGDCNFTVKVKNAQDRGAVGVIMANNVAGNVIVQGGEDDTVTIPSMMVTLDKANEIKSALASDPNLQATLSNEARPVDGTLDNGIVAHEWGHYLSNRLVGNSNGLTNNQGRSMGEGWSDFVALLMAAKESDNLVVGNENFQGVYSASTFVGDAYDGIRRAPYSTDMSKNALTFRHIEEGVGLPLSHPISFGISGASNSEVHATGEVWANTLWEVYVGLINKPGNSFSAAQQQMKDYLVASLKLTPNAPTLLEARDALLAAALANDSEDFIIVRDAFAKRGMGANAIGPDRESGGHAGVVEDFTTGIDLQASIAIDKASIDNASCDIDGILDNNETATLVLSFKNYSAAAIPQFELALAASANASVTSNVTIPAMAGFGSTQTVNTSVTLDSATFMDDLILTASFPEIGNNNDQFSEPSPIELTMASNFDLSAAASSDDMSSATLSNLDWTVASGSGVIPFVIRNGIWHGEDTGVAGTSDLISPSITLPSSGDLSISFDHFFKFESSENDNDVLEHWDGGVIEVSMDDGPWTDVIDFGASLSEVYNGTIQASTTVLANRNAYVDNRGSRTLTNNVINFPQSVLTGTSLKVRFRIGTDSNTADFGWQIDNFVVTNAAGPMFSNAVVENNACVSSNLPVVNAGADIVIVARDNSSIDVNLTGTATDADGDTLTISWVQVSGPNVTLNNADTLDASFTAPSPSQDTDYVFSLTADDGGQSASTLITVSINPNQAPAVSISNGTVEEGASFTLNATSSDNEGDSLSYQWTQTAGPTVSLSSSTVLSPSFTAPDVDAATTLSFQLIANDGSLDSSAAMANITVSNKIEGVSGGSSSGGGGSLSVFAVFLMLLTRLRVSKK